MGNDVASVGGTQSSGSPELTGYLAEKAQASTELKLVASITMPPCCAWHLRGSLGKEIRSWNRWEETVQTMWMQPTCGDTVKPVWKPTVGGDKGNPRQPKIQTSRR